MAQVGGIFVFRQMPDAFREGDMLVQFGTDAFVTTATSKEVTTDLSVVDCALLTIDDVTPVANDLLGTDRTVTSGAVTVARPAGTTSGLSFNYLFIGRRWD